MSHHGVVAADELDDLYSGPPDEFTERRKKAVAAARQRGDAEGAKRIGAARKPTVAAWVVNALVHDDPDVRGRLSKLGEQLRSAHAAMDGGLIRTLSARQRRLVDDTARAAFGAAGVAVPSAALRDDVVGTLQAAVADPEVTGRLGRLVKAERWSGFGGFGATSAVQTSARATKATAKPKLADSQRVRREPPKGESNRRAAEARAALRAAEQTQSQADETLAAQQSDLATARLRHDDARRRLEEAQHGLEAAEAAYADAKQAVREAAGHTREIKAAMRHAGGPT